MGLAWDNDDISRGVEKQKIRIENIKDIDNISDFIYVRESIPGMLSGNFCQFEDEFQGCDCEGDCCSSNTCECLKRSGQANNYDDFGNLLADKDGDYSKPIFECNRNCKCKKLCGNRVVQNGAREGLQVFDTITRGFGLRTTDNIDQGTFVCEYAGEVLSSKEARLRTESNTTMGRPNYILVVNEYSGCDKINSTIIDPSYIGNVGRFANHSCSPNCCLRVVRVNTSVAHVAFFARRPLKPFEEITFDYGGEGEDYDDEDIEIYDGNTRQMDNGVNEKQSEQPDTMIPTMKPTMKQNSAGGAGEERTICLCGAKYCRGYLPFDKTILVKPMEE